MMFPANFRIGLFCYRVFPVALATHDFVIRETIAPVARTARLSLVS